MPDDTNDLQSFVPSTDTKRFRSALGQFATGVTVVTARTDDGPIGITANSFASVSLDPPLVLWSPAKVSNRFVHFTAAQNYAIHVLGADQIDLCHHFANKPDFAGIDWATCPDGAPLLAGCLTRFECRRVAVHDGGDHVIIIGEVKKVTFREGAPLLFSGGRFGHFEGQDDTR